jgi:hypothetical protein
MAQVAAKILDMFCKFYLDKNCNNNIGSLAVENRNFLKFFNLFSIQILSSLSLTRLL